MLPVVIDEPFDSADHIFEVKWGGVRAISRLSDGEVRVHGRNLRDLTPLYPELSALAKCLRAESAIVDGELVAWGAENLPSFDLLRRRLLQPDARAPAPRRSPLAYQVFDLLELDGEWLLDRPLSERRNLLHQRLRSHRFVGAADFVREDGVAFFDAVASHKLPGIVAKELSSAYAPGEHSRAWQEVRATLSDEFAVGGYSFGGGRRNDPIASLLIGGYRGQRLDFVGEVSVGHGDREARLLLELLTPLHTPDCPFATRPSVGRLVHWCRPELACQVQYGGWGPDGRLRFPVFVAPRPDVPPEECVLEGR
jgi:DNA ligase D-like protein (predicted ligase)